MMRSVLSRTTLAALPPHVCHRHGTGLPSIGSHMQQDMDISKAPSRLGAAFLCLIAFISKKHDTKKLVIVLLETWLSFVTGTTRVFRAAGRHKSQNHAIMHMQELCLGQSRPGLTSQL